MLQDLAIGSIGTLREIASETSAGEALQLIAALSALDPAGDGDPWLRCLQSELLFVTGDIEGSHRIAEALEGDAVPLGVADSARFTAAFTAGRLRPRPASPAPPPQPAAPDVEHVAAWAVHADDCWAAGRLDEGIAWARQALARAALVPSPFWQMYLRLTLAGKLADVGAAEVAQLLAEVRQSAARASYPGIDAAVTTIEIKLKIRRGEWATIRPVTRDTPAGGAGDCWPFGEDLAAQLSIAATYAGDGAAARSHLGPAAWFEALPRDVRATAPRRAANDPPIAVVWARLLVAEEAGPAAVLELVRHLATQLPALLAQVPGAAAWLTQCALRAGDQAMVKRTRHLVDGLRRINPGQPQIALSADHVHAVLADDTATLGRVAARHDDRWTRTLAAESLADVVADAPPASWDPPARDSSWQQLSIREREVATMAGEGLTNRQIATRIGCSPHTVNFHMRNVFGKLGIGSRVEIVRHLPPGSAPPGCASPQAAA